MAEQPDPRGGENARERASSILDVDISRPDERHAVITPVGEVDMLTAPMLVDRINAELAARRRRVVVDLTKLTFFGSAGAAAVVSAVDHAKDRQIEVRVVVDDSVAARVLGVTGLLDVLPIYETVADALSD